MEQLASMAENSTKRDLLTECRNGNREAMSALFVENQKRVFSVALNFFGGDQAMAQDMTQEVFLKIFQKLDFRGDAEFTTWLYRITVNACIDETRKTRRFLSFSEIFGLGESKTKHSQDEKIYGRELGDEVQQAIAKMKPKFRLPILLKYVEDLSYQEIAEILGCSVGTVSSRLNRGHKLLASKLAHLKSEFSRG